MILTMTMHHAIEQAASIDVSILEVDCCLPNVSVIVAAVSNVRVVFHLPQVERKTLTPFEEEGHAVAVGAILDYELRAFRSMGFGESWSRTRCRDLFFFLLHWIPWTCAWFNLLR